MGLKLGAGGQDSTCIHSDKGGGETGLVVGHCLLAVVDRDIKVLHEGGADLQRAGQ